jgi:hypothetical protein
MVLNKSPRNLNILRHLIIPIFRIGMSWERAVNKKNMLKKNLNSLYKTTGMKVSIEYF